MSGRDASVGLIANVQENPASPTRSAPTITGSIKLAAADIKLAHSVFALPFAILGAFLARDAAEPWSRTLLKLTLVIICMVGARTWAMLVNRLADAGIDAANPRTVRRAIASGALSPRAGLGIALLAAAAFIAGAAGFWLVDGNWWPLALSVPVLAWLAFYSFAKRFTLLCHVLLGSALAISPLAAAIAVRPGALADVHSLYWLAGMVLLWVAGFDVIYALQDVDYDQRVGLHSIPAKLGVGPAIILSRVMHTLAAGCLLLAALNDPRFGWIFLVATAVAGGLLIAEHIVLAKRGKAGLEMAFFTLNGIVSCVVGLAGVLDLFV